MVVSVLADYAAQPEAGRSAQRHGPPDDPTVLTAHAYLVSLHKAQVLGCLHQSDMHLLAVLACPLLPGKDGALVQVKGRHESLHGTAKSQQRHDPDHDLRLCLEGIEGHSLAPREGLVTDLTSPAIAQAVVDFQVACTAQTS